MQDVSNAPFARSKTAPAVPIREVPLVPLLGEPHRFIDVGHSRLAYWKIGAGPDLVFVHGWPLHSATFRKIVPLLANHFTCHLVDLPGSGHTVCPANAPLDVGAHAETLHRATEAIGLDRYALLAHDSGGFIARLVAARDRRVTALVLGNTEVPGPVPGLIRFYAAAARLPLGASTLRLTLRSRLIRESPLGFGNCFSDKRYLRGEFHDLFVEPILESQAYAARMLAALDFSRIDELESLHRSIRVPVLLAWGDRDPFFPIARARAMLEQFGGLAELSVLEGAKLFAHEERPEEFAALARDFLLAHAVEQSEGGARC